MDGPGARIILHHIPHAGTVGAGDAHPQSPALTLKTAARENATVLRGKQIGEHARRMDACYYFIPFYAHAEFPRLTRSAEAIAVREPALGIATAQVPARIGFLLGEGFALLL